MEELCTSFVELDMESKFFEVVPYDSDDPDFTWHANVSDSDEDEYPKPQSSSSLSCEKDNSTNPNRKHQRKIPNKCDQKTANVIPKPEDETSKVESSTSFNWEKVNFKRRSQSPYGKNQLGTSDTDSDSVSNTKEFIKRHRSNILKHSLNEDDSDFKANCITTFYPSSKETPKTISSSCPKSTETESNNQVPVHVTPVRKREQRNQEKSYTNGGLNRTFPLSSTSEGESCSYAFKSPHKKFKHSPKLNRPLAKQSEIMPCYRTYQLLGDSQLLRFSEQLLNYKSFVSHTEHTSSRRLGYCVSGQKIQDLEQRILKSELKLLDKLIILIGTNDMVYDTKLKSMCDSFDSLLTKLKRNAERIVVLTVPPVPRLANDSKHILKLKQFNDFLMNCADNRKVFLVDLASLYISYSNTISEQFFEPVFYKTRKSSKVDLIHLNRNGFKLLRAILDIEYFDKFHYNCR